MTYRDGTCYAPTFKPARNVCACFVLSIVATMLTILLGILALFSAKIRCYLKGWWFRVRNCAKGNSDSRIVL